MYEGWPISQIIVAIEFEIEIEIEIKIGVGVGVGVGIGIGIDGTRNSAWHIPNKTSTTPLPPNRSMVPTPPRPQLHPASAALRLCLSPPTSNLAHQRFLSLLLSRTRFSV